DFAAMKSENSNRFRVLEKRERCGGESTVSLKAFSKECQTRVIQIIVADARLPRFEGPFMQRCCYCIRYIDRNQHPFRDASLRTCRSGNTQKFATGLGKRDHRAFEGFSKYGR